MMARYERRALAERIGRGVGALSLGAIVSLVGQLAIVPVAMLAWGEIRYGEWLALSGLVAFLKLTDLGIQTYVVNRFTAAYATGRRDELERLLHSAVKVQLPLVAVVLVALGGVLFVVPLESLLGLQTIAGIDLVLVAWFLGVELLSGVPMGVFAGVYRATGRLPRAAVVGACRQLLLYGCTIGLVAGGSSFVTVASARLSVALLVSAFILIDLKRLYPWLRLLPTSGSWREGLAMVMPGLFFLLVPVAEQLSNQFTILVVQRWLEGGAVSRLATHRTAINLSRMASGVLATAVWPELTALHARGERDRLFRMLQSLTRLNLWIVGLTAFGLLPFLPWIYPAWTAGRLELDTFTLGFLIGRAAAWSVWGMSGTMLLAINRPRPVALCFVGAGFVTGVLAVALVPVMGISGAVLAAWIGDLCLPAWFVSRLAARELGGSATRLWTGALGLAIVTLGLPLVVGVAGWRVFSAPVMRYLLIVPACTTGAVALMWWRMEPRERSLFREMWPWGAGAAGAGRGSKE